MQKTNQYTFNFDEMTCKKNNQKFGEIVEILDGKINVMVTNKRAKAHGEIMTFVIVKNDEQ